jgi:hypothetical protein
MDRKDWMPTHARTFGWQGTSGHQAAIARLCLVHHYSDIVSWRCYLLLAGRLYPMRLLASATADGRKKARYGVSFHFSY